LTLNPNDPSREAACGIGVAKRQWQPSESPMELTLRVCSSVFLIQLLDHPFFEIILILLKNFDPHIELFPRIKILNVNP
jgi:hypothetical protein